MGRCGVGRGGVSRFGARKPFQGVGILGVKARAPRLLPFPKSGARELRFADATFMSKRPERRRVYSDAPTAGESALCKNTQTTNQP